MSPADIAALIAELESWTIETSDFHRNREIADQVLLLDGWKVQADSTFEGGFRWYWGFYSTSESTRPHPILSLESARGLVPLRGFGFRLETDSEVSTATFWEKAAPFSLFVGTSQRESVAIVLAFLRYRLGAAAA